MLKEPMNECPDYTSARKAFTEYFHLIFYKEREDWLSECPVPCDQTIFDIRLDKFHQNNLGGERNFSNELIAAGVMFILKYNKFVVEKQVETLVYDTGNFLAQAGGNLGLFLGFSCLSLLLAVIKFIKNITKHKFC